MPKRASQPLLGVGRNADPTDQLEFLNRAGELLTSSLEYERTIEDVCGLIVPRLADWCSVEMVEPDGTLRSVAIAHEDETRIDWAQRLRHDYPPRPGTPPYQVVRSARPLLFSPVTDTHLAETAHNPHHLRLLRAIGLTSAMLLPIGARDRTCGLLSLMSAESGRTYDEADVAFAEQLTRQLGLAIDNARLYGRAQKAKRAQAEADAVADGILTVSPVGAALLDRDLRYLRVNEAMAAINGKPVEEHLGRTVREVIPTLAPTIEPSLRQVMETREPIRNVEVTGVSASGEPGTWLVTYYPVENAAGDVIGAGGFALDVTQHRVVEEQLRHMHKMEAVGRLAGGIAHDFNNLLTAILGYSELMLSRSKLPEDDQRSVREIRRAAERATSLTGHLLAFSRRQVLEPTTLRLNDVITDVERMLRRVIGEDIAFETKLDPELWDIHADPGWLAQVLLHLAVNARDAMPRGGVITIETANARIGPARAGAVKVPPGSYVTLTVSDTGVGMEPEVQEQIFDPFFTTKEAAIGTGLGLSTVYGIVRQSGGHVTVRSQPGEGTSFDVYIPRARGDEPVAAPSGNLTQVHTGTETVLLVEDADIVRDLVERILLREGYAVLAARDAEEAMSVLEEHGETIDLLITDIVMPLTSGPELASMLRQRMPELRILYMSGYTDETLVRQGLKRGEHFLQKPFAPERLKAIVRDVIEGEPEPERTTVLIVDDDVQIRTLVDRLLGAAGYECRLAASIEEAREALRAEAAPICLCDLNLGTESGLDLVREFAPLAPEVALVMMSGADDAEIAEQALRLGAYDFLVKPFRRSELLIAVSNALRRQRLERDSRELHRQLEVAVETRTLELALSREETIQRLARAVEFRDTPTGKHVERMSAYCRMLAKRLGIPPDRAALIRTASLLHDIGKLGIPDRILAKPGKLDDAEWSEMQTHTTLGHQLLSGSSSELVGLAATIALTHHERVDGKGYPQGLRGDEIPVEGRIAAVCDVFDALTSSRPYRARAFRLDEAVAIMRPEGGKAFDAEIFDTFFRSLDEVKVIRSRYTDSGNVLSAA